MKRGRGSAGMVWLELLVALAVAAFVALAGIRALSGFLEQLAASRLRQNQQMEISALQASFQQAWDQRSSHRFQADPWLEIDGAPAGGAVALTRLQMRSCDLAGKAVLWELFREQGAWVVRSSPVSGEPAVLEQRGLAYTGRIHLAVDRLIWLPGDVPKSILWSFPDARTRELQDGFAIDRLW